MSATMNIDQEWANFISNEYDDASSDEDDVTQIVKQSAEEFLSANLVSDITSEAPLQLIYTSQLKQKLLTWTWKSI